MDAYRRGRVGFFLRQAHDIAAYCEDYPSGAVFDKVDSILNDFTRDHINQDDAALQLIGLQIISSDGRGDVAQYIAAAQRALWCGESGD